MKVLIVAIVCICIFFLYRYYSPSIDIIVIKNEYKVFDTYEVYLEYNKYYWDNYVKESKPIRVHTYLFTL